MVIGYNFMEAALQFYYLLCKGDKLLKVKKLFRREHFFLLYEYTQKEITS